MSSARYRAEYTLKKPKPQTKWSAAVFIIRNMSTFRILLFFDQFLYKCFRLFIINARVK